MRHDIWKFISILIASALFGYTIDHILLPTLLAALSIIAWQIYRFDVLYKWIEDPKKNPMPEVSGQVYGIYREIFRSNTKNAKRKKQLNNYLSQFRKAVGALPDAIILIDDNGKIEWANKNADHILGIRWPDDSHVRFSDLIRYPEVDSLLQKADSKAAPAPQGVVVNSISQSEQVISFKCVRYTNDLRMIIARDVSRLIQINQMHADFVANVSHELKTPLTVLKGYIEILQNNPNLPATFSKPLAQMTVQSTRMEFIVSDLLYLAKLEDKANKKPHEHIDITHLINTIIDSISPLIEEKHHKIELDIDHSLSIIGTQSELHSAFSNLIANAIYYTPKQGYLKVRWYRQHDSAIFSVKDNGIGIAAHHLERLTQRFYRVDNDRSRDSGGTGLGLAIVKHVLQRHEAELLIESEERKGSVFRCVFPMQTIFNEENKKVPLKR